jgi:hypothetical protein
VLKVPGGYLTPQEQDELIRYILEGVRRYPQAHRELQQLFAEEIDVADLSPKTLEVLRSLAYKWLMQHKK